MHNANRLFNLIQEKYDEYGIKEKPYIMIKADSGTYGMGIMQIDNIEDLKNLNRKQRTKMSRIKGGNKLDKVILQEGIKNYEECYATTDTTNSHENTEQFRSSLEAQASKRLKGAPRRLRLYRASSKK